MADEWDLTAMNQHRLREQRYEVAVLPTGAIEAHNLHLPCGQDLRHTTHVAREACRRVWRRRPGVLCLPPLPYGVDGNLMAYPGTFTVTQATLDAMVREIIASSLRRGLRKFVIVNGHGGNDFAALVRQAQCDLEVHVFVCDWWKVGQDRYAEIFDAPDDHAGEMETSVALALFPELVDLHVAGDGRARPFRLEALRKGWVRTSRDFAKLNDQCAVGDPSAASAEKGRAYLDLVCGRLGDFLAELAAAEVDAYFPFVP